MKRIYIQKSNLHLYLDWQVKKYSVDKRVWTRELYFAGYLLWAIDVFIAYMTNNVEIILLLIVVLILSLTFALPTMVLKKPMTYVLTWAYTYALLAVLIAVLSYTVIVSFAEIQNSTILLLIVLGGYCTVGFFSPRMLKKKINKGIFREGANFREVPINVGAGIIIGVFLMAISRVVPLGTIGPALILLITSWGMGYMCHLFWCYNLLRKDSKQVDRYKTKRLKAAWFINDDEKHSKLQLLR